MLGLIGAICAAVFNVLIGYWVLNPYTTPRVLFLAVAGFVLLTAWLISGPVLYISGNAALAALVLLAVWAFCSFMAIRKDIALRRFVTFGFCVFFGLFLTPAADSTAVMMMLVGVATVSAAVGLIVNIWHVKIFKQIRSRKKWELSGMVGNCNAHAAYLAVHVFLAGYLAVSHHRLWAVPVAIFLWAIYRTRSRGPVVGLMAGFLFLSVAAELSIQIRIAALFTMFGLIRWAYARAKGMPSRSMRERWNYWRVALRMFSKSPFFGIGPANFPIRVPHIQRELNEETKGEFLKRENYHSPWPELAHNDFLQALVDTGVMGIAALIAIAVLCCAAFAEGHADPQVVFVSAAIVAVLAAGLTWHLFYVEPVNMTLWCLVGILLKQPTAWTAEVPAAWTWLGLVMLAHVVWKYVIGHGAFQVLMLRYFNSGDVELLKRALRREPHSTFANQHATLYCWRNRKFETAYTHCITSIQHFDGHAPLWKLWTNLGSICDKHGSLTLANAAFNEALKFLPWYDLAIIGREQLKENLFRISRITNQ